MFFLKNSNFDFCLLSHELIMLEKNLWNQVFHGLWICIPSSVQEPRSLCGDENQSHTCKNKILRITQQPKSSVLCHFTNKLPIYSVANVCIANIEMLTTSSQLYKIKSLHSFVLPQYNWICTSVSQVELQPQLQHFRSESTNNNK